MTIDYTVKPELNCLSWEKIQYSNTSYVCEAIRFKLKGFLANGKFLVITI